MGKICIIKSCPSGRKKINKTNHAPQSLSYFQPRTPARMNIWKKSLGIDLKPTSYVCHLHFKSKDIKTYEKICINGEVKFLPTGKKILKEEALPTTEHQYIPEIILEHQKIVINELQEQYSICSEVQQQNYHKEQDNIKKEELFLEDCVWSESCPQETEMVNIQENNCLEAHQEISPKQENNCLEEHQDTWLKQEINCLEEHQETLLNVQSINHIKNNIKQLPIVPPLWFYVENNNNLEFMRINLTTKLITNHIRLNQELSITVIFSNKDELVLNEKLSSIEHIYEYLKCVEKWPLCVGTQIESKRYSKTCKGVIIGDDTYRRPCRYPRCKACRILRHCLQKGLS